VINASAPLYQFDSYRVDTQKRQLLRDGETVPLTSKVFDTLLILIQHKGQLLEKQQLMRLLWPDTFVEEGNISVNISVLRKALEESPNEHRYIVTVPGRGYKFIADVETIHGQESSVVLMEEKSTRIIIEEEEEKTDPKGVVATRQITRPLAILQRLVLLLLAATVAGYFIWTENKSNAKTEGTLDPFPKIQSIAILPFRPLKSDADDLYLGLGMADALITKLSGLRQLIVRPTSAILRYNASDLDSIAAGREQRVDAVMEGTIQRAGDKIRISARLLRVRDGASLWAYECTEGECKNMFQLQDLLSVKLADSLLLNLSGSEKAHLRKHYTNDPEAYQDYVKGMYYWNKRTSDGLKRAISYFEDAIRKDPNYALAYSGLADCYSLGVWYIPLPANEALPKLKAAALKAIELDDQSAEAHLAMTNVYSFEWNWPEEVKEHERTIELNPGYATGRHWNALSLALHGRAEESIAEAKRAIEIDPLSLAINTDLGWVYYFAHRYDEAIKQYQQTLEMDPSFTMARFDLALAYSAKGMHQQAIQEMLKTKERGSEYLGGLGYVYGISGDRSNALKTLEELKLLSKTTYVPPYHFAWIYIGLGDKDQALLCLTKVYQEHTQHVVDFKSHPMFDPLRSDPRFVALVKGVGL